MANVLFWAAIFGLKGSFDWFFVIKPLEVPIKALWGRGWIVFPGCTEVKNPLTGLTPK